MALTAKKLLAIDWDKKDLRMAMIRSKADRIELLKAVSVPLPSDLALDNAELLGAFIREATRQSGLSARHVLMSIPRDQAVLNTLNLPPTPADDLPAIIQFQVVKELPFDAAQATIDFAFAMGHEAKAPCSPLVAAIRNEELEFYKSVAKEAGLTIERVGLRPFANLRAVIGSQPELASRTVLMVEVGPFLTEINVVHQGSLTFSRAAMVPLPRLDQAKSDNVLDSRISMLPVLDAEQDEITREAVGRLMVDVIRSYEAHRATAPQTSVDQIVVCGATGLETELAQSLAARFAAKAELFTPDRLLDLSPQRAKELRGFSAVIGLSVGHARPPLEIFDFNKPKKQVSKRTRQLRKAPIAIGTAVLVVGFGIWAHINFVQPKWADAEKVRLSVEKMQKIEKPYKDFIAQVKMLQEWTESEQYWPEVIADLSRALPSDQVACVDRLDLDMRGGGKTKRYGSLEMKMRVADSGTSNAISEALRAMGYQKVEAPSETPRGFRDGEQVYRFDTKIKAELPDREPRNWDDVDTDDADAMMNRDDAATEADTPDVEAVEKVEPSSDSKAVVDPTAPPQNNDGGAQ
ncbi:MAG: pilus assembly protein PilM [Planctomycetes bacterium]|nr:pilus assembly protein PilM [Planctomycetota bacterium]